MGLDVKLPIGLLFTIFGVLLAAYGFLSDPAIYVRSFGINVNLLWGAIMFLFGVTMLFLCRRSREAERGRGVRKRQ